jgi:hypothetical protein
MSTRSPYWKLAEVENYTSASLSYQKLTYWNGIDQYHRMVSNNTIEAEWVLVDAFHEMNAYQDFLRALPDDQCREIVNARRFLQVVHQAMSKASKPKVGDEVCLNNVPLGSVVRIEDNNQTLLSVSSPGKDGLTIRFVVSWFTSNLLKITRLPYRLAECQAAFSPEHHTELAELIYLHDGDLRERWMLFTDMLEEGRWGDKYQPWAKHILEVMQNLGRPLTIYDEVFLDLGHYMVRADSMPLKKFANLIIPPGQNEVHSIYCSDKISQRPNPMIYGFIWPHHHITNIGPP